MPGGQWAGSSSGPTRLQLANPAQGYSRDKDLLSLLFLLPLLPVLSRDQVELKAPF